MKRSKTLSLLVGAAIAASVASAHEFEVGGVEIDHPWARPTAAASQPAAAYFVLKNTGDEPDRLIEARVAEGFAQGVELHTTRMDDGVMQMRQLQNGAETPPGETVAFEPGGRHVMLFGLAEPLAAGDAFPMTLVFEKAGEVEVEVKVENADSSEQNGHHH